MDSVYVGQGLEKKTEEECLRLGLNPNSDEGGSFSPELHDSERMRQHIEELGDFALFVLCSDN